jgi:hypothetical protein
MKVTVFYRDYDVRPGTMALELECTPAKVSMCWQITDVADATTAKVLD